MKRKRLLPILICLLFISILAGCKEYALVLTINPDGSCAITRERTFDRLQVEMYVNKMEARYARQAKEEEQDVQEEALSEDEKLKARFIKFASMNSRDNESLTWDARVNDKTFTTIETRKYEDVESFIQEVPSFTNGFGMVLENEDGYLRVSMASPQGEWGVYAKESLKESVLDSETGKCSIKIVLPGKVISSDLGQVEKNATWLDVNPKEGSSGKEAGAILDKESVSVVCEMGGLNASLPLSSFEILNAMEEAARPKEPELPVTKARPGYLILPYILKINERISYAQDAQTSEERRVIGGYQTQGIDVHCNMYVPSGNVLIAIESVRALSMTDDRGVTTTVDKTEENQRNFLDYIRISSEDSKDFSLKLPLPDHRACALESVKCEAVVLVAEGWKQSPIKGSWADPKVKTDLSRLIPGAYMIVRELNEEPGQGFMANIEVIGPPEIHYLYFSGKQGSSGQFNDDTVDTYSRDFSAHGDMVKGEIMTVIRSSKAIEDFTKTDAPFFATYPVKLRREKVTFTLKGLDLM